MKLSFSEIALAAVVIGGIALVAAQGLSRDAGGPTVSVRVPPLSATAAAGKVAFDVNFAVCHGANAAGTDKGPPFVHDIYNPGHHPDEAFFAAARYGVQAHHWQFGNMPPVPQVNDEQLQEIVRYVRELQLANGIVSHPHRM